MVISPLNIKLLEDRLGFISHAVERMKRLAALREEEFLSGENPAAAESYLRRTLEAMFDIGRHITARMAGKGIVEYKDIARALCDHGIIRKDSAATLVLMAGYRNRLVHFYHEITERELYRILCSNLFDIEDFSKQIATFLRSLPNEAKLQA